MQIKLRVFNDGRISARDRLEDALLAANIGLEDLAQLRDVHLQRICRCLRRCLAPKVIDQLRDRHDSVGVQEEERQQRPLFRPSQIEDLAALARLERAEDLELDGFRVRAHERL